jgi:hypothetical protein
MDLIGSATAATAQGPKTTSSKSGSSGGSTTGFNLGSGGTTTSSSSSKNAMATKAAYLPGVAMALAGGIAAAAM